MKLDENTTALRKFEICDTNHHLGKCSLLKTSVQYWCLLIIKTNVPKFYKDSTTDIYNNTKDLSELYNNVFLTYNRTFDFVQKQYNVQ